ncbi:dienelactone hydrolase family protein [Rhodobaculum claviforme]|uniref:Dienelactone hydrolase n=1 Tax=Rhodobaculum claviforme TaxID=1549854 RepID=A0A934WI82_9RHOB|nr:dienelactone hydrolase family protein [Rhodobaculum claviforme]MBK5926624.1 dienelactone hydrolase [Rhodobaculum claviforme]
MFRPILCAALIATGATVAAPASAQIVTEPLRWEVDGAAFEGMVARNTNLDAPRGVVVIVHDWNGIDAYERGRAEMLAAQGFTAVAVDLFGTDAVLEGIEDYRRETGALYADRGMFRARLSAALEAAGTLPGADAGTVIMGYCFGGAAVLEAARMGADLAGFVSFHGGLTTPEGQDWHDATGAPMLVLHGSADPVSGMADLGALMDELQAATIPHRAEIYGGALHSFTVWGSDDYDLSADRRAWRALTGFLDEIL